MTAGGVRYRPLGASRAEEKRAFESFIDFVTERWDEYPGMHIYHFAPYEPAALKRLMGRYATREERSTACFERASSSTCTIVRHSIRAGVESYSIKRLEPLYGFERTVCRFRTRTSALAHSTGRTELDELPSIRRDEGARARLQQGRLPLRAALRDWLEGVRGELVAQGKDVPRPQTGRRRAE